MAAPPRSPRIHPPPRRYGNPALDAARAVVARRAPSAPPAVVANPTAGQVLAVTAGAVVVGGVLLVVWLRGWGPSRGNFFT